MSDPVAIDARAGETVPGGSAPAYDRIEVGYELPTRTYTVDRQTLIRYAGASLDFNPIHWSDRVAREVGLPDVIAHGMFTMATAIRLVTEWTGDPGAVTDYTVRFSRPVVVPDDGVGASITVAGVVAGKLDDRQVKVNLTVTAGGEKVLSLCRAVVRLR